MKMEEEKQIEMEGIQEEIQGLLCKMLEVGGNIILNSNAEEVEDKLDTYQRIVKETQKINTQINSIISVVKDY